MLSLLTLAAILALAACSPGGDEAQAPVQQASVADVASAITVQADRVAEIAGAPAVAGSGGAPMDVMACSGKSGEKSAEVFYILAGYHLKVGADRLTPVVEEVHEYWRSLGWQVREVEYLSANAVRVRGSDPASGFGYELSSTGEPSTLLLWINSPCRADPTGTPPLGPYSPPQ